MDDHGGLLLVVRLFCFQLHRQEGHCHVDEHAHTVIYISDASRGWCLLLITFWEPDVLSTASTLFR